MPLRRLEPKCGSAVSTCHGTLAGMSNSSFLDLIQLRRGCTYCSVRELCLPGGIGAEDLQRLDQIVQRRRPVARGERLFRLGDPLTLPRGNLWFLCDVYQRSSPRQRQR